MHMSQEMFPMGRNLSKYIRSKRIPGTKIGNTDWVETLV